MNRISGLLIALLGIVVWCDPLQAITRVRSDEKFGISELARADTVLVLPLDSKPLPGCLWDFTDSLRFARCYPVLGTSVVDAEWSADLGFLLSTSEMAAWDSLCGYSPLAIIRFAEKDQSSDLVVFEGACDKNRMGLLLITPGHPMEYRELLSGREDLRGMMDFALSGVPVPVPEDTVQATPAPEPETRERDRAIPEIVLRVEPVYPPWAGEGNLHGTVALDIRVDPNGRMGNFRIARGVRGLNDSVVEALRQWRFLPATEQGKPVKAWISVSFDFPAPPGQPQSSQGVTPYH